jgi:hypothetical protein
MPGLVQDALGFIDTGRAAKAVANSNIAAEHGVLDATSGGQTDVAGRQAAAAGGVTQAVGTANDTLGGGFAGQTGNLNPYLSAGAQGTNSLAAYAASKPTFNFDPSQLASDPGYQFQLGQGTAAINNSASAGGLLSSGNTLEALANYGQGLAGTYLNNAFARQQGQFQTNQNATLANLSALSGIGLNASQQFNNASQNNFNQQANNTLYGATYGGNTGIQAGEFNANLGQRGATTAGNFAVGAGTATGAGILGQGNALGQGIADAATLAAGF